MVVFSFYHIPCVCKETLPTTKQNKRVLCNHTMHHKQISKSIHIRPKVNFAISVLKLNLAKNSATLLYTWCWLQWNFTEKTNFFALNFDVAICQTVLHFQYLSEWEKSRRCGQIFTASDTGPSKHSWNLVDEREDLNFKSILTNDATQICIPTITVSWK